MEPLLQARDLYRHYGERCAVAGLNLELGRGEILGLLGPNGAGKSTSLRMLSGVLAPSAGRIHINGADLWRRPRQAKSALGYLPERLPLYPELRVDEYLSHCARLRLIPRRQVPPAIEQAKKRCGLAQMGHRLIANLSRGYRQRLGIAQTIVHQPQLVILDEPTVGLDPHQVRAIRDLIRELASDSGVILSSHILPEVQSVCSRVQILHQGRQVYASDLAGPAGRRLLVQLERPPETTALEDLPGVSRVEPLENKRYRLHLEDNNDLREEIACRLVGAGWGLLQLQQESEDLERIFIEVTSGDETCPC